MFPLPCTHFLCTCGLFRSCSLCILLCLALDCLRDCVTRPGCCMDADGLFMGDATLRKIFCLQETLRGVRGRPPLTESLLQPERLLFLPSPLLQEKTAVLQTPNKRAGYHLTPTLFQLLLQMQARTHSSVQAGTSNV